MHNVVVVDTAGGLGIEREDDAPGGAAIRDAVDPDEILFVVDAMIGQDAVATAQAFLDGSVRQGRLIKRDGGARGAPHCPSRSSPAGRSCSLPSGRSSRLRRVPPDRMASRILDLGDILTLIEQAERRSTPTRTAYAGRAARMGEGFTLEDFVGQLAMVRKLGRIGNSRVLPARPAQGDADQVNDRTWTGPRPSCSP